MQRSETTDEPQLHPDNLMTKLAIAKVEQYDLGDCSYQLLDSNSYSDTSRLALSMSSACVFVWPTSHCIAIYYDSIAHVVHLIAEELASRLPHNVFIVHISQCCCCCCC